MEETTSFDSVLRKSETVSEALSRVYEMARILRSEGGCPWDKKQTPASMRSALIEETFEACDAVTEDELNYKKRSLLPASAKTSEPEEITDSASHVKEELGDVLFNIILSAYMYEQQGAFTVSDIADEVCEKLIRRHPHVFGTASSGSSQMNLVTEDTKAVLSQWDRIKENVEGRAKESILDEIPEGLPPLMKAYKQSSKACKKNFKWQSFEDAQKKVMEEYRETVEAADEYYGNQKTEVSPLTSETSASQDKKFLHLEEEIGDLLHSIVTLSHMYKVDPSVALERANSKFYERFTYTEKKMEENSIPMDSGHISEMINFWNEYKKSSKN